MKPNRFPAQRLEAFLQLNTVATLPELKTALGPAVAVTVFRKLSTLPYRTSYSHRGAYYTLDPLAHYDELGLWSYRDIHFSRQGTLLDTTAALVTQSPAGYFTDELEAVVRVAAKDALRQLLREETAGDPMARRGLWTGLRLEQISSQLRRLGISVCPNPVRRLLDEMDYALRANRKSLSGHQSPERDRQFRYRQVQRQEFTRQGLPIISVDTKKKEMVGPFKNAGQVWSREPIPVNGHDFRSRAQGMAIPRGLYDVLANRGSVLIGTSHDTSDFAVDAIVDWWRREGRRRYGQSSELLILADSGGSNGARCRLWKCALQEKLADRFGLAVTVCHYPTIVRLIGETKTKTGLRINCGLTTEFYPTKIKVSDVQMAELDLVKHPILPNWNYTLLPRINRN